MSIWDVVVRLLVSGALVAHRMVECWMVDMGRAERRASSVPRRRHRQRCEGLKAEAPA
jgi:hypothetical protein